MTYFELRKLRKSELVQKILDLEKENDSIRSEKTSADETIKELTEKLESKELSSKEAGSIAEEALKLNGIFESAQKAADEYLEALRRMNEKNDEDYRCVIEEAMSQADDILRQAEEERSRKIAEADSYWAETSERFERLSKDHEWFSRMMPGHSSESAASAAPKQE